MKLRKFDKNNINILKSDTREFYVYLTFYNKTIRFERYGNSYYASIKMYKKSYHSMKLTEIKNNLI